MALRAKGMPWGWIAERSVVLFLLTSAINVFVLGLFGLGLAVGILPGPSNLLLGLIPAGVGFGVLAVFLALPAGLDRVLERRAWHHVNVRALNGLAESIRDTETIVFAWDWRLIGPVAYLVFDIAVLWVCFVAVGQPPPLASLVLGYQIGYLSNLIPVPGSIGVLEGGLIGALVLYGANATTAAAAVLVYHAIALAVPLALGFLALLLLSRTLGKPGAGLVTWTSDEYRSWGSGKSVPSSKPLRFVAAASTHARLSPLRREGRAADLRLRGSVRRACDRCPTIRLIPVPKACAAARKAQARASVTAGAWRRLAPRALRPGKRSGLRRVSDLSPSHTAVARAHDLSVLLRAESHRRCGSRYRSCRRCSSARSPLGAALRSSRTGGPMSTRVARNTIVRVNGVSASRLRRWGTVGTVWATMVGQVAEAGCC